MVGVMCFKRVSAKMKGKVWNTIVRTVGFDLEKKKRKKTLNAVAPFRNKMDWSGNEWITKTAHVRRFGDKVARLRLFVDAVRVTDDRKASKNKVKVPL